MWCDRDKGGNNTWVLSRDLWLMTILTGPAVSRVIQASVGGYGEKRKAPEENQLNNGLGNRVCPLAVSRAAGFPPAR